MFDDGTRGPNFAFAGGPFGAGGDDEGPWQPWARGQREGPGVFSFGPFPGGPYFGPRMLRHFARRFGFGPGGPRMFGRGDLKYALLDLLQERPKHGYEMIKELEDRSGGFYSPSAGAIYPTLQLLEDRGWVTTQTSDAKKVYSITDAGRQALTEQRAHTEAMGGPGGPWGWGRHHHEHGPFGHQARPELRALREESVQVARLMRAAVMASGGDPERLARLRAIVTRTRGELETYLGQTPSPAPESSGAAGDAAPGTPAGGGVDQV
jgi:DNA-binding PadR family transcriptional regulator